MISLTPDQLSNTRAFFATNPSAENIYSTAQNLGLSSSQLADVYSQATGASASDALSNINAYLGQTGQTLTGGFTPQPIQVTPQQPQTVVTQQPTTNVYEEAANALRSAAGRTEELMGYTPEQIQAVLAQTPKTIPEVDMAAYMNPYTQEVINRTQADILRQQQMAENALGAQAAAAGAFGGSRFGVAQGVLGGEYGRIAADTAANLRQQGYTQAANLAQQDISNQIRADLANQAAQNLAAYQNVTSGLQGAQLGLSGAQQLANIGNLGFGMANTVQQQMMQQGTQQQALIQGLIDLAKAQYGGYTGAGTTGLGLIGAAGQGIPVGQTTTTSGGGLDPLSALLMIGMAPVTGGGSLFGSMLGGGAAAGAGAAGLGGGFSVASNPAMLSDIRLKDDINQIGVLPNGLPIYTWKWNDKAKEIGAENNPTIGVMAQEAMQVIPSAVIEGDDGYLRVNYAEIWK